MGFEGIGSCKSLLSDLETTSSKVKASEVFLVDSKISSFWCLQLTTSSCSIIGGFFLVEVVKFKKPSSSSHAFFSFYDASWFQIGL